MYELNIPLPFVVALYASCNGNALLVKLIDAIHLSNLLSIMAHLLRSSSSDKKKKKKHKKEKKAKKDKKEKQPPKRS